MPYITVAFKTIILSIWAIIIRGTLPRYRFDQLTSLTWKHFVFIWLGFLIFNAGVHFYFL